MSVEMGPSLWHQSVNLVVVRINNHLLTGRQEIAHHQYIQLQPGTRSTFKGYLNYHDASLVLQRHVPPSIYKSWLRFENILVPCGHIGSEKNEGNKLCPDKVLDGRSGIPILAKDAVDGEY